MAGAIDAWLNPNVNLKETVIGDEKTMITASRCKSIEISTTEGVCSAILIVVLCLIFTFIGVTLDKALGPNIYVNALLFSAFFMSFTIACGYTFLKPYSRVARNVLIWLATPLWYLFFLAVAVIKTMV